LIRDVFTESDEDVLKLLIAQTPLRGIEGSPRGNLLNIACANGTSTLPVIPPLLERLANEETPEFISAYLNNYSSLYGTSIYAASYRGQIELLDMLLQTGADLISSCGHLGTPLNAACAMGRLGAIKWLLQHGSGPVGEEAMQLASRFKTATHLLTRYNELGVEGLAQSPETTSAQDPTILNAEALGTEPPSTDDDTERVNLGTCRITIQDALPPIDAKNLSVDEEPPDSGTLEVAVRSELHQTTPEPAITDITTQAATIHNNESDEPIEVGSTPKPTEISGETTSNPPKESLRAAGELSCTVEASDISVATAPVPVHPI
jgi:hypothetical protein